MKLTTAILVIGLALGTAWGQNPSIIDATRAKLNAVQQQKTAASDAALSGTPKPSPSNSASAPASKPAAAATAAKPASHTPSTGPQNAKAVQPAVTIVPVANPDAKKAHGKPAIAKAAKQPAPADAASTAKPAEAKPAEAKPEVAVEDQKTGDKKDEPKNISMSGRRDPFISPVVSHITGGSGCNTGKRCLAVDQIALTGVVKADTGMIAVVVNAMNKAYFLRENDPVFNGYVVKITGDSIIFKETIEDKLGKPFTREVTKKISTPAV
jgi:hypothetical protein